MVVTNVQVVEGKASELNFTLAPLAGETSGAVTPAPVAETTPATTTQSPTETAAHAAGDGAIAENSGSDASAESSSSPDSGSAAASEPHQPQIFRHHHYADMMLFLRKYNATYPSITRLYSVGKSVEGRELYVMEITDNPGVHEPGSLTSLVCICQNVSL